MNCPIPGSELTREPFRWDQRLFSLVLRLAGTPAAERDTGLVPSDSSPIDAMCEVTGGKQTFILISILFQIKFNTYDNSIINVVSHVIMTIFIRCEYGYVRSVEM